MFKKFLVFFVTFAFVTVQVNATSQNSLKLAFDELSYSLNVEWNQADRAFYDMKMEKFTQTISQMQENGLSNEELVNFAINNVKDANFAQEVKTLMLSVQLNNVSSKEARKMVIDMVAKSYNMGASWTASGGGNNRLLIGAIIIILILVAIKISTHNNDDETPNDESCEGEQCDWEDECNVYNNYCGEYDYEQTT